MYSDVFGGEKTFEMVPVPGARAVTSLKAAPNGMVYGWAEGTLFEFDPKSRKVTRSGKPIELTAREFELLEFLLRFEGQVVSRETLAREVWQERGRTPTLDNVIDAHVARLRKKIDAETAVKLIHTVRGVGFVVREEAA